MYLSCGLQSLSQLAESFDKAPHQINKLKINMGTKKPFCIMSDYGVKEPRVESVLMKTSTSTVTSVLHTFDMNANNENVFKLSVRLKLALALFILRKK